ncbi:MAG: CRTAC1 family protein [Proteobacteria bacterium]|nr:CRTAC1 family protein [Pseudomonadota bacterium]
MSSLSWPAGQQGGQSGIVMWISPKVIVVSTVAFLSVCAAAVAMVYQARSTGDELSPRATLRTASDGVGKKPAGVTELASTAANYADLTALLLNQLHLPAIENKRNAQRYRYLLKHLGLLEWKDERQVYEVDWTAGQPGSNLGLDGAITAYHAGDFTAAIQILDRDIETHGETEDRLLWLGMSYMRRAEEINCLDKLLAHSQLAAHSRAQHTAQSASGASDHTGMCSLPLAIFHTETKFADRAAEIFERLLRHHDADNPVYRWLHTFNRMTTNRYPDGVSSEYAIDSHFIDLFYGAAKERIKKRYSALLVSDRAAELGVNTFDAGKGVAIEDFDNDGFLDIVTGGIFDWVRLYHNDRGRRFIERLDSGLNAATQAHIITAADYDNDGWIDVFVGRPFHHYQLFRNLGNGTFRDVTHESGLVPTESDGPSGWFTSAVQTIRYTWASAFSDVDRDGDLDLFIAQWGIELPSWLISRPLEGSRLLINQDGRFIDRTAEYGLDAVVSGRNLRGVSFGDYNSDGYPDLFVSSTFAGTSALLRNVSGKRFEPTDLIDSDTPGFMAAFLDINHDGLLDLFQAGVASAEVSTARAVFGEQYGGNDVGRSRIFVQSRSPTGIDFADRHLFGDELAISTMGANYGDLNNDGCHDFYLGTGNPMGWFVLPNLMYIGIDDRKNCSGRMDNISMLGGLGTIQKGHGIVFFDFDEDGDQDIYSSLGGLWPGDRWQNQLFVNDSRWTHSWIKVRLYGVETNRSGIGARIKVMAKTRAGQEIVRFHHMDHKTGFGSSPYRAHIGLADAVKVTALWVYWPVSRTIRSYPATINQSHVLHEHGGSVVSSGDFAGER